ncbi:MAG TPA: ATP-binding protein [Allocoleopsis sp.]
MTDLKTLISYVAYYVSRGKAIISPLNDRLSFQGLVYQYHGYHRDFLLFWQQLQQQRDFYQLCLEGDTFTFKHLLEHQYEIGECARCYLPIPTPIGSATSVPACPCDREPLLSARHQQVPQKQCGCSSQPIQPDSSKALVKQLEHNFNLLRAVVIGSPPLQMAAVSQLLTLNGFQLNFVEAPAAAIQLAQNQPIDLILIDTEISEEQGQVWSQQLRQAACLQYTPVIGFSSQAGEGLPWSEQRFSITDYLLMPLSGQHLTEQLRQLLQQPTLADAGIYWFPRLPPQKPIESPSEAGVSLEQMLQERTVALEIACQQQNTLQQQVQELESSHRRKDDFLNTVSHELRTPITNVKMAIRMLEVALKKAGILGLNAADTPSQHQKIAHYLQILQLECDREISLINELLDLQRLEANSQTWVAETIQLQTWLPHLVEPFQSRTQQRQQQLQIAIAPDLPSLTTDLSSLERILAELLNNACKYTPAQAQITLSVCSVADRMQLTVSNSGIEIPLEQLPHIFEQFYRISSHDPWKEGGTGLGLTLVQKLVERLGGNITVESGKQQTRFRVELPLQGPQL